MSGELIGGTIGAVIGSFFGQPQLGWTIGSMIGGIIAPDELGIQDQQGPNLKDLTVTTSTFGAPLPIVYGSYRIAGNIIWSTEIKEHEITKEVEVGGGGLSGLFGGGESYTQTDYVYSIDCAIAVCEGPIYRIRRIWADSVKIYDMSVGATVDMFKASNLAYEPVTLYNGTNTQEPDWLMQQDLEGSPITPGYRNTAYVVLHEFALSKFGNRIPNFTFEVLEVGHLEHVKVVEDTVIDSSDIALGSSGYGYDPTIYSNTPEYVYILYEDWIPSPRTSGEVTPLNKYRIVGTELELVDTWNYTWGGGTNLAGDTGFWGGGWYDAKSDVEIYTDRRLWDYIIFPDHPDFLRVRDYKGLYDWNNCGIILPPNWPRNGYNPPDVWGHYGQPINVVIKDDIAYGLYKNTQIANDNSGDYYISSILCTVSLLGLSLFDDFKPECGTNNQCYYDNDVSSWQVRVIRDNILGFDVFEDRIYVLIYENGENSYVIYNLDFVQVDVMPAYNIGSAARPHINSSDYIYYVSAAGETVSTWEGEKVGSSVQDTNHTTSKATSFDKELGTNIFVPSWNDSRVYLHTWKYNAIAKNNTTTVGAIVEDLLIKVGITADQYDVTEGTDIVPGYCITKQMPPRNTIATLQSIYLFDLVEEDFKIKIKLRTGEVDDSITEEVLGANDEESLNFQRAIDTEMPNKITVKYKVIDRDYLEGAQTAMRVDGNSNNNVTHEAPLVLEDTQAKNLVDKLMYQKWSEKVSVNFTIPLDTSLKMADTIQLPYQGLVYTFRITKMSYNANYSLSCEATGESSYKYDDSPGEAQDTTLGFIENEPYDQEQETHLKVFNGPTINNYLSQQVGVYYSAKGYADNWRGCVVYMSIDKGINWKSIGSVYDAGAFGGNSPEDSLTTSLASSDPLFWDLNSSFQVRVTHTTKLVALSIDDVYRGGNYALIGQEVIQFMDCVSDGDDRYTLSTLLRGRLGTEWATTTHSPHEDFIFLGNIERISSKLNNDIQFSSGVLSETKLYKAVAFGSHLADVPAIEGTPDGTNLVPLSPYVMGGGLYGANYRTDEAGLTVEDEDFVITWVERSRNIGGFFNSVPSAESTETYILNLYDFDEVLLSTHTLTPPDKLEYKYSNADQKADVPYYLYTAALRQADGLDGTIDDVFKYEVIQVSDVMGNSPSSGIFTKNHEHTIGYYEEDFNYPEETWTAPYDNLPQDWYYIYNESTCYTTTRADPNGDAIFSINASGQLNVYCRTLSCSYTATTRARLYFKPKAIGDFSVSVEVPFHNLNNQRSTGYQLQVGSAYVGMHGEQYWRHRLRWGIDGSNSQSGYVSYTSMSAKVERIGSVCKVYYKALVDENAPWILLKTATYTDSNLVGLLNIWSTYSRDPTIRFDNLKVLL